jgi:hypothetical protein
MKIEYQEAVTSDLRAGGSPDDDQIIGVTRYECGFFR